MHNSEVRKKVIIIICIQRAAQHPQKEDNSLANKPTNMLNNHSSSFLIHHRKSSPFLFINIHQHTIKKGGSLLLNESLKGLRIAFMHEFLATFSYFTDGYSGEICRGGREGKKRKEGEWE